MAICRSHGCFLERFHQVVVFFKEVASCKELVFCRQCAKIAVDWHLSIYLLVKGEGLVTYLFEFTMVWHVSFGNMGKLVGGKLKARLGCEEVGGMDALVNDLLFHFFLSQ